MSRYAFQQEAWFACKSCPFKTDSYAKATAHTSMVGHGIADYRPRSSYCRASTPEATSPTKAGD